MRYLSLLLAFGCLAILFCCATVTENATVTKVSNAEAARIELGRYLFYDAILSRDSTVSCATCHQQQLAFTDGLTRSEGIKGRTTLRNAPTLSNVANRPYFLLDGVNPSLEAQITAPIQEHAEFDFNLLLVVERVKQNPTYVKLAKKGYGTAIDTWVILNAIAEFERTFQSYNAPYDAFISGNSAALSKEEQRGMTLFFDELYCAKCHTGNDFTNDALTNNGLYETYSDSGRMRLTRLESDRAIFKVPTLRNVGVTAPYMHDGSVKSLEAVIRHYESGGSNHAHQSEIITSFELNDADRSALVAFLNALTDATFLSNPKYSNPFN